ncbi:hypothetical protein VTO73DRAFT_14070 [Trametes versicolor]
MTTVDVLHESGRLQWTSGTGGTHSVPKYIDQGAFGGRSMRGSLATDDKVRPEEKSSVVERDRARHAACGNSPTMRREGTPQSNKCSIHKGSDIAHRARVI